MNRQEPMLELFLYESLQLIEQLEEIIIAGEKEGVFSKEAINEIFRVMHTIKGSSAMMMFQNISTVAHSVEDIFYSLREQLPAGLDYSALSDLVLEGVDFFKVELEKIKNNDEADGDPKELMEKLKNYLSSLDKKDSSIKEKGKQTNECKEQNYVRRNNAAIPSYEKAYYAVIHYEAGCEMENLRAYTLIRNLKEFTEEIVYIPESITEDDESIEVIRRDGFKVFFQCNEDYEKINELISRTIFLRELELEEITKEDYCSLVPVNKKKKSDTNPDCDPDTLTYEAAGSNTVSTDNEHRSKETTNTSRQQSIISVNVEKLDMLLNLVGEMVISEAMVIQNPDLIGLELSNFDKAARQLSKVTGEIQDIIMSIRMVPLTMTFQKMHRIVRDMGRKLKKEVELIVIGEQTEVDKNIIEHISDPLMHLVRNAVDHGLEAAEERLRVGKAPIGTVTIEARNAGSDVLVTVRDDGAGLDKNKILLKAVEKNLLYKNPEDMTDKEINNLILLPGFSTNEAVTEFSGRGVGMDVVMKNIETVGGTISIDSVEGRGTSFILKLPLTLAIIDGMNIRVGKACYTLPTIAIKESFRPKAREVFQDPEGNEMIMVRGQCLKVIRLHELFGVHTDVVEPSKGIIIIVEQDEKLVCLLADELIGQQQVVVKALPKYITNFKKIRGLAGCTLLGDGSISLILDIGGLVNTIK